MARTSGFMTEIRASSSDFVHGTDLGFWKCAHRFEALPPSVRVCLIPRVVDVVELSLDTLCDLSTPELLRVVRRNFAVKDVESGILYGAAAVRSLTRLRARLVVLVLGFDTRDAVIVANEKGVDSVYRREFGSRVPEPVTEALPLALQSLQNQSSNER